MGYNNTIVFGALTLIVDAIKPMKVPGTIKQVVGKRLITRVIPARSVQDWAITITGKHVDTNRNADRDTLTSYDDKISRTLTDGIHDGDYFIQSLTYNDRGDKPTSHSFTLVIIQDQ